MLRDRVGNEDPELERRIRDVADSVREYGVGYAEMIRQRERGNPRFEFLEENDSVSS